MKKKISGIALILVFLISCTTNRVNISRIEAYKINSNYIMQQHKKEVDNKLVGFYISKAKYNFYSLIKNMMYEIVIDKNGKVINEKVYSVDKKAEEYDEK